jgi:hypothetical protein
MIFTMNQRISMFHPIFTILAVSAALFAAGCADESTEPLCKMNLTPFKELAGSADCADIHNRLYVIDGRLVFWEREGNCPDNAYYQKMFGGTIDEVLCDRHDSIAGPVRIYYDDGYRTMFDTIIANIGQPDLGLGPDHTVQPIPF